MPLRASRRFTPTRVGKSEPACRRGDLNAVHPHTCGEIAIGLLRIVVNGGSPPHVWGNLLIVAMRTTTKRFTPTRVGKSYQFLAYGATEAGSPPHVWGNLT